MQCDGKREMFWFWLEEAEDGDVKQKGKKVMIEVKLVVKGAGDGV